MGSRVTVKMNLASISFFRPFFIRMSPMGERQSVGGDMMLIFSMAPRIRLAGSSLSFEGFVVSGTSASVHIFLAVVYDTLENSFTKKEVSL